MTAAQQLRQEGRQQGIQKGVQKGRQEEMYAKTLDIAKHMLSRLRLNIQIVSKVMGLSEVRRS
jgi:predicted transposase YdaD